jgi:hypothetical protein
MGRAAAIAFAREGADVAINYLPAEEPDAREVVQLIKAAGRNAAALPGDVRTEVFCKQPVDEAVRRLGGLDIWSTTPRGRSRTWRPLSIGDLQQHISMTGRAGRTPTCQILVA